MRPAALLMLLAVWLPLCGFAAGDAHAPVDSAPSAVEGGHGHAATASGVGEGGAPDGPGHPGHRGGCSGVCCCVSPPLLSPVAGTLPAPLPTPAAADTIGRSPGAPLPRATTHLFPDRTAPPAFR